MIWLSLHIQIYIQTNFTFDIHSLYIQNTFIIHSLYIQFQILIHKISEFDIRYTFSSKFLYIKYHNFIFVIHSVPHSWTKHFPIIYLLYAKIKIFRYNISQLDIRYTFSFRFLKYTFKYTNIQIYKYTFKQILLSIYIRYTFKIHSLYIRYTFSSKFLYIKSQNLIFVIHSVPNSYTLNITILYSLYIQFHILGQNIFPSYICYTLRSKFSDIIFHN